MYLPLSSRLCGVLSALLLSACRSTVTPVVPEPAPRVNDVPAEVAPAPKPVAVAPPTVRVARGPLVPRVVYPDRDQLISARDSNFILGSVGAGDATLTINGSQVAVHPSGTFLAWLPLPAESASRYELVVARGTDTVRRTVPIRLAKRSPLPADGRLRVDSASLEPRGTHVLRGDDRVRVALRAPSNASVLLETVTGRRVPLASIAAVRRAQSRTGAPGNGSVAADAGVGFATDVPARWLNGTARVLAIRNGETVQLPLPRVEVTDTTDRTLVMLKSTESAVSDTDRVVVGRPVPAGTYRWFLLPGTIVERTGRQNGWVRVRLDRTLEIWVEGSDVVELPDGVAAPRRVTGGARVTPANDWVDVTIPMGDRPAFSVQAAARSLVLTLHDVQANPEISPMLGTDPLIRQLTWDQVQSDRAMLTVRLDAPLFGYRAFWDEERSVFVLRVRRVPPVDASQPLRGLRLVVDPGHPPVGSTGPSGVSEPAAVLPVGLEVARQFEARGAIVTVTRGDARPVGLLERTAIAQRADAHAFISVHLNALPDGVNPFTASGTSTLFFHQMSEPLARQVQRALVPRLGLRDLGIHYQNLAVARPTWYPSALAEGLFIIVPEQEALVLSPAGQRAYADGLVAGVEAYFRELIGLRR
jgi:N-acetylmuramoyl-L-alanine amidase